MKTPYILFFNYFTMEWILNLIGWEDNLTDKTTLEKHLWNWLLAFRVEKTVRSVVVYLFSVLNWKFWKHKYEIDRSDNSLKTVLDDSVEHESERHRHRLLSVLKLHKIDIKDFDFNSLTHAFLNVLVWQWFKVAKLA